MEFQEGQTIGIDLGTTFSTAAHLNAEGEPVALANDDGDFATPSLILLAESGHVIVGPNRMRAAMENPDNVVERIKRDMGSVEFKRTFDGREITPEFISALILKKLRQDAETQIGKVANAVVTVPAYFNDARRKATEDAGRIAGLNVIDIINEPTAATLTYAWQHGELGAQGTEASRERMALVYDLGGGTFDVSVVKFTPTHFQVLATDGDVHLGGVDWNDRLLDHVAGEFQAKHGADIRDSAETVQVLRNDCDQAKILLSEQQEAKISCRHGGKSVSVTVTRDEFETMTADLMQRTLDTMDLVLEQAGIAPDKLDAVVLVGGSTLMPAVPRRIKELTGVEPFDKLSPYTAVAEGAAIHAAILEAKHRGGSDMADTLRRHLSAIQQDDVNSHGLGVVATNPRTGKMVNHVMIKRNSQLPIEVTQSFKTNKDGQDRVSVSVTEGDAPDPAAVSLIGKCRITDLPADLPKGSPIAVTYSFDESGRVHVRAEDVTGGRQASIEIQRRGGLDAAQIDVFTVLASDYQVD